MDSQQALMMCNVDKTPWCKDDTPNKNCHDINKRMGDHCAKCQSSSSLIRSDSATRYHYYTGDSACTE